MKKEIESTSRSNDDMETKILQKDEEIDGAKKTLEAYQAELDESATKLAQVKKEVESKMGEFDHILEEKLSTKEELEAKCDKAILNSYRMIRDRKYQDALVAVVEGACQGCFMNIPPQMANLMLQNPNQLEKCPNCQRLIYWQQAEEA
ncbi:MAG: C4-type zinc ribbon domain-containing protein [Bdellovibrionota bacterium]